MFEKEKEYTMKGQFLEVYIKKQKEIQVLLRSEEKVRNKRKFEKMSQQGSIRFWRERREIHRDDAAEWVIIKDKDGRRIMYPEANKEIIAEHYEELYSKIEMPFHPYHQMVEDRVSLLSQQQTVNPQLDSIPTREEIKKAITHKKNNKATTDWRNEILKRGGDPMIEMIMPVIETFWDEEEPPSQ